ncbi:MAG TPA: VWA domain-containing protein [Vicinamibacterales bacterium]|nr:VWA domain-containing protein [Vicinamibacterales bacterium]
MTRLAPLAVALIGLAVTTAAQQPTPQQPVFRTGTDTVSIYTTVFDRYGEIITDLGKPDFKIFDEGKRQDLTHFVNGQQPITAVVLIDTSASMTPLLHLARAAAEQFIIRMQPGDRARVGSFNDRTHLSAEFTGDRDRLLRTIREDLRIGHTTALWDALDQTMTELAPLGGRRVILLLTDGFDTQSQKRSEELLARAYAEELMVYAVQFRPRLRQPDIEMPLSQGLRAMLSNDIRRERHPTESLRRLAVETGGGHFLLTERDDVNSTFTRVANELHQQYVLGFSLQKFDGKPHALDVLVSRPDMVVRARKSYLAPLRPGT